MTENPPSLPFAVSRKLDQICDRFEKSLTDGEHPRIEDYLSDQTGSERQHLLGLLLAVELELLGRKGTTPDRESYASRFPADGAIIDKAFRERVQRSTDSGGAAKTKLGSVPSVSPERKETIAVTNSAADSSRMGQVPPASGPAPSTEGKTFGKFRIRKVLGQGAFGAVFHGFDPQLDRNVAIKVPHPQAIETPDLRERFLREAKAAANLRHPGICPVFETGELDGRPYIVMAFIKGPTLAEYLGSGKSFNENQTALLIQKVAQALEVAHRAGIIHRDLKPGNIMLDSESRGPVVTDFGLARIRTTDDLNRTQDGQVMGTPYYMPPEQARGDIANIGPRSDVYSLGVVLYELLAGRVPFQGGISQVLAAIERDEPTPPSQYRPGLDSRLEAICLKAMSKRIEDRYQSMGQFAQALGDLLKGGHQASSVPAGTVAKPVSVPTNETAGLTALFQVAQPEKVTEKYLGKKKSRKEPNKTASTQTPPTAWFRDRRVLFGGLAALVLLGIVVVIRNRDGSETRIETPGTLLTVQDGDKTIEIRTTGETSGPPVVEIPRATRLHHLPAGYCMDVAYTADEKRGVTVDLNGELVLWDLVAGKKIHDVGTFGERSDCVRLIAGDRIACLGAYQSGWVKFFEIGAPGPRLATLQEEGGHIRFTASKDGSVLLSNSGTTCRVYRVTVVPSDKKADEILPAELRGKPAAVQFKATFGEVLLHLIGKVPSTGGVEISRVNPNWIYVKRDKVSNDFSLWDVAANREVCKFQGLEKWGQTVRASENGRYLFAHTQHKKHLLWDAATGQVLTTFDAPTFPAGSDIAPDGSRVLIHASDAHLEEWQLSPPKYLRDIRPERPRIHHVYYIDNGNKVLVTGGGGLEIIALSQVSTPPTGTATGTPDAARSVPPLAVFPLTSAAAESLRRDWAAFLGVPERFKNSLDMEFVLIPPGEFEMGSPVGEPGRDTLPRDFHHTHGDKGAGNPLPPGDQERRHHVRITRPFYLATTELTQGQFETLLGANATGIRAGGTPEHPVGLMGSIAERFIGSLNKRTDELSAKRVYRFPTEAEWEYSCRAGSTATFHFGADASRLGEFDWFADNANRSTHPVARKKPNAWGLFDMLGNVREWCADHYAPYPSDPAIDPIVKADSPLLAGPPGVLVVRGGSYATTAAQCRSAWRFRSNARTLYNEGFGIRLACEVVSDKLPLNLGGSVTASSGSGTSVDLLPLIDTKRDSLGGEWKRDQAGLVSPQPKEYAAIQLPITPAAEYEIEMNVVRQKGKDAVLLIPLVGGSRVNVGLDCEGGRLAGLSRVWGNRFTENQTGNRRSLFADGKPHTVRYVIRKNRIETFCDGVKVIDWEGDPKNLSIDSLWKLPVPEGKLLIAVWNSEYRISRLHYRPQPRDPDPALSAPPVAKGPFNAAQAIQYRQTWADHLGLPVEFTNSIGMKFSLIPPIHCEVGGGRADQRQMQKNNDRHRVLMTKPIYMGQTEVTQDQYLRIMGSNPAFYAYDRGGSPDHPVEDMSWGSALSFAAKLSALPAEAAGLRGYRLPTEHEWEIAARAGVITDFPWGETVTPQQANLRFHADGNGGMPMKVASFPPNPWGIHDSVGNVAEWVWDARNNPPDNSFTIDPIGPEADRYKAIRGGAFTHRIDEHPLSYYGKWSGPGGVRVGQFGFRVAMTIPVDPGERKRLGEDIVRLQANRPRLSPVTDALEVRNKRIPTRFPSPSTDAMSPWKLAPDQTWQASNSIAEFIPGTWYGFDVTVDGKRVVTANGSGDIWIWDIENCTLLDRLSRLPEQFHSLVCSPVDSNLAYVVGYVSGNVYRVKLRERLAEVISRYPVKDATVRVDAIAVSADGRKLLVASPVGPVRILDAGTGEVSQDVVGRSPAAFSPESSSIVYVTKLDSPQTCLRWNLDKREALKQFAVSTKGVLSCIAPSPDDTLIALGLGPGSEPGAVNDDITLFRTATGKPEKTIKFQMNDGNGAQLAFSPEGNTLWAWGRGRANVSGMTTNHYDVKSGALVSALPNQWNTRFNPADPSIVYFRPWGYTEAALGRLRLTPIPAPNASRRYEAGEWIGLLDAGAVFEDVKLLEDVILAKPEIQTLQGDTLTFQADATRDRASLYQDFDHWARNAILRTRVTIKNPQAGAPNMALCLRGYGNDSVVHFQVMSNEFEIAGGPKHALKTLKKVTTKDKLSASFELAGIALDDTLRIYLDGKLVAEHQDGSRKRGHVAIRIQDPIVGAEFHKPELYILDGLPRMTVETAERILLDRGKETASRK